MSIKSSLYDFFTYIVPGGLFLVTILGTLQLFGISNLELKFNEPPELVIILLFIAPSYIIGHILGALTDIWINLFESRSLKDLAYTEFVKLHPKIFVNINPSDLSIWFASIKRESLELAMEIDRMMAISDLLAGVSFFLGYSSLILLFAIIFGKIAPIGLFLIVVTVIFSIIMAKQSIKFHKWFYHQILETILSRAKPFHFDKESAKNTNGE